MPTKTYCIRLEDDLVDALRARASTLGIGYQTLLKRAARQYIQNPPPTVYTASGNPPPTVYTIPENPPPTQPSPGSTSASSPKSEEDELLELLHAVEGIDPD